MTRRVPRPGPALALVALALLVTASFAGASAPEGPRLAVVKLAPKPPRYGLFTVDQKGARPVLVRGAGRLSRPIPDFFSSLAWSPEGETLAFSGIVGFRDGGDEPVRRLFLVRADGTDLRPIRGSRGGSGPVFSSDGRTIAFTRSIDRPEPTIFAGKFWEEGFSGSTAWTIDLATSVQRRLTPWRHGLSNAASSFSPDGSTLLVTRDDSRLTYEPQPVALELDGSGSKILVGYGSEAVYSPDGAKIAFTRSIEYFGDDGEDDLDLFVVNTDGTGLRRLTRTPGRPELSPSWDPSGERLAYVRLPAVRSDEAVFGYRNALMQVNADGSCETKLISARLTFFFAPAWQPGPGRGAGRIEC